MPASGFAEAMGIVGTVLLCLYEVYPVAYVKKAIDTQNAREIPYKVSMIAMGYHICWILYYDTINPDFTLLMLNIVTLIMCVLASMAYLFLTFETRSAILFCSLFSGSAFGFYMFGRVFLTNPIFRWYVTPVHSLCYLNMAHDTVSAS
jgi:hypothetical protein